MNNKRFFILIVCFCFVLCFDCPKAFSQSLYVVEKTSSRIDCSVRYTVVGHYEAEFEEFNGEIIFDKKEVKNLKVDLNVKTASINSGNDTFDRIVRSKRLLDAKNFSTLEFASESIENKEGQYFITGMFKLHGVSKRLTFPFQLEGPFIDYSKGKYLKAKGAWKVNRKEFGVVWNKVLDKGGVIVGDYVTVDWEIIAVQKL